MKMKKMATSALRVFLGGVFLLACWDKILHPGAFAEVVYNYQILPGPIVNLTALVLPVLELLLAIGLIFGIWLPGTLLLATLLLAVFFGALLFNMARGLDVHCGCFSTDAVPGEEASTAWYLIRDAGFLVTAAYLLWQAHRDDRAALDRGDG